MLRVYIAAPWKHKARAQDVKAQLHAAGVHVTSRWMDFQEQEEIAYEYTDAVMQREAINDIQDVAACNVMLYLNLEKSEGKATELGMAIALNIPVFVVGGKQNNVFLHLPNIQHLENVEAFLALNIKR